MCHAALKQIDHDVRMKKSNLRNEYTHQAEENHDSRAVLDGK